MLSNHFWDGFVLGALIILGAFLLKNLLVRAAAKK